MQITTKKILSIFLYNLSLKTHIKVLFTHRVWGMGVKNDQKRQFLGHFAGKLHIISLSNLKILNLHPQIKFLKVGLKCETFHDLNLLYSVISNSESITNFCIYIFVY